MSDAVTRVSVTVDRDHEVRYWLKCKRLVIAEQAETMHSAMFDIKLHLWHPRKPQH